MKLSKKIRSFILLPIITGAIMISSTALADETEKSDSHSSFGGFGVHGGWNFNDFNFSNGAIVSHAKQNTTGSIFGVHLEGISLGMFGVRVEANYSTKGYELAQLVTVSHHYLQIPLLFKLSPIAGPIELYVEAGPAIAIHLSSTYEVANASVTYTDNADKADFSVIGGVGVGIKVDPVLIEVEARYDYGLTNLSSTSNIEVDSRAIQVIAGITFLM